MVIVKSVSLTFTLTLTKMNVRILVAISKSKSLKKERKIVRIAQAILTRMKMVLSVFPMLVNKPNLFCYQLDIAKNASITQDQIKKIKTAFRTIALS